MIIGAIVSALTYTISAVINSTPITLSGFIQSTVMGAVSAMVTFGIGEYFTSVKSFIPKMTYQALAHGTFQGAMTGLQGGKFWNGFAAGSLSSIASSLWQGGDTPNGQNCHWNGHGGKFAQDTGGIIAFGTIAGGTGAALTGGNFWQGAVTGFFVSGLNHAMHQMDSFDGGDDANVYVEKDGVGHAYVEVDGTVYSYGRYNGSYSPASGSLGPLGDGVLLKLDGQTASNFISERTANYPTEKFTVKVNASKVKSYYNKLYNNGTALQGKTGYNAYGRVIGTYNLVGPGGNNCTTLTYKALNYGGANIRPAQTPAGMLYDFRQINYINQGYNPSQRLWGPK